MGYAQIISGGPAGRYFIRLDNGEAAKAAALAGLSQLLAQNDVDLADALAAVAAADELETQQIAAVQAAVEAFIEATEGGQIVAGSPQVQEAVTFEVTALRQMQIRHIPIRARLGALQLERANVFAQITYWNQFQPIDTRQAWCADLTENIPAGSYVATCDVPGDTSLVLIAPSGRSWLPTDGIHFAREVCSPEQAFYNAAILPGWQKFAPTYRTGVAASIDYEADTMTVSLDTTTSTAQRLNVNQSSTLDDVPVVYLSCNAQAFDVGDRVLVQFIGQNWDAPRVVGFVDNPQPCEPWPDVLVDYTPFGIEVLSAGGGSAVNWATGVTAGDQPGDCGPVFLFVEADTPGAVYRRFSRFENLRFQDSEAEDNGFEIISAGAETDWGTQHLFNIGSVAPAASPARFLRRNGENIEVRLAAWQEYTYPVYFSDPPDIICQVTGSETANFWTGYAEGDDWQTAWERNALTVLGTVPTPTVQVRRNGITKTYQLISSPSLPFESATITQTFGLVE